MNTQVMQEVARRRALRPPRDDTTTAVLKTTGFGSLGWRLPLVPPCTHRTPACRCATYSWRCDTCGHSFTERDAPTTLHCGRVATRVTKPSSEGLGIRSGQSPYEDYWEYNLVPGRPIHIRNLRDLERKMQQHHRVWLDIPMKGRSQSRAEREAVIKRYEARRQQLQVTCEER